MTCEYCLTNEAKHCLCNDCLNKHDATVATLRVDTQRYRAKLETALLLLRETQEYTPKTWRERRDSFLAKIDAGQKGDV